jgi:hypothetical protein
MVRNANALKEGIKPFILTTLIRLDDKNFPIKRIKNFGFMMNEINPYEFAEVINEANIVLLLPKESIAGSQTSVCMSSSR